MEEPVDEALVIEMTVAAWSRFACLGDDVEANDTEICRIVRLLRDLLNRTIQNTAFKLIVDV